MKPKKIEQLEPPTPLARRFVRYLLGFSVGVTLGLAPFLGIVEVPGFKALLDLMPFQIRFELIPLSAFLMGIVVVAVQFYAGEQISRATLRSRFLFGLKLVIGGFILFTALWSFFTERVERGDSKVAVMIGLSRIASCGCEEALEDAQCIITLSFNSAAIQSCWGSRPLRLISLLLSLSYLTLTSGFGVLIGFLLLQEEARRRAAGVAQNRPVKRPRRRGASKPVESAPQIPPSANDESVPESRDVTTRER